MVFSVICENEVNSFFVKFKIELGLQVGEELDNSDDPDEPRAKG